MLFISEANSKEFIYNTIQSNTNNTIPYNTIQCNTILCYTILYYTILYYTILYYTILYYTILYDTILYYMILYYTILYYTIQYYIILYYIILYYTILYHTVLYNGSTFSNISPFSLISASVHLTPDLLSLLLISSILLAFCSLTISGLSFIFVLTFIKHTLRLFSISLTSLVSENNETPKTLRECWHVPK